MQRRRLITGVLMALAGLAVLAGLPGARGWRQRLQPTAAAAMHGFREVEPS